MKTGLINRCKQHYSSTLVFNFFDDQIKVTCSTVKLGHPSTSTFTQSAMPFHLFWNMLTSSTFLSCPPPSSSLHPKVPPSPTAPSQPPRRSYFPAAR